MSTQNTITQSAREAAIRAERAAEEREDAGRGFEIPPDVAKRFEVRTIAGADNEQQRMGLFRPGDVHPAIEVLGEQLVANREDPDVIEALVKIAKHNGWDSIDVDGTPEFRKAVWAEATRAGLTVNGYEPDFVEQEQMAAYRRKAARSAPAQASREAAAPAAAPAAPKPPEKPNFDVGVEGTIVAVGEARYDSKATRDTPFVDLQLPDGRQERAWGVALPDALEASGKTVADAVLLKRLGVEPVEVSVPVVDRDTGEVTHEPRTVRRNQWLAADAPNLDNEAARDATPPDRGEADGRAEQFVAAMEAAAAAASEGDGATTAEVDAEQERTPDTPEASGSGANDLAEAERTFDRLIRSFEERGDPRATTLRETAAALVDELRGELEAKDVAQAIASEHDEMKRANKRPNHEVAAEETIGAVGEASFEVRTIAGADNEEERIGVFGPGDADPAIEVIGSQAVANLGGPDPNVIEAMVKIARHAGQDSIDVDGTPEFRKAVWDVVARAGLAVNGHEPGAAEQEQMAASRRGETLPRQEERRHERDEIADLFLHGSAEAIAVDPRLAGAREAQAAMELHIAEVFKGDPAQIAAANLESRTMISVALSSGRDVSVREPTPVRQIEPARTPTNEMER